MTALAIDIDRLRIERDRRVILCVERTARLRGRGLGSLGSQRSGQEHAAQVYRGCHSFRAGPGAGSG